MTHWLFARLAAYRFSSACLIRVFQRAAKSFGRPGFTQQLLNESNMLSEPALRAEPPNLHQICHFEGFAITSSNKKSRMPSLKPVKASGFIAFFRRDLQGFRGFLQPSPFSGRFSRRPWPGRRLRPGRLPPGEAPPVPRRPWSSCKRRGPKESGR